MTGLRRKLSSPSALFIFEAAARYENFTSAANELNITQPAVSRALATLESHIGSKLFLRGKPGVRLTENGKLLRNAVISAFSEIERALNEIEERRTGKTQVTLSVSTAFTTHWLMPRITRFQSTFPNVDLRFQLIPGPEQAKSDIQITSSEELLSAQSGSKWSLGAMFAHLAEREVAREAVDVELAAVHLEVDLQPVEHDRLEGEDAVRNQDALENFLSIVALRLQGVQPIAVSDA